VSRARNLATILGSNTALGNLAILNTITDTQIENNAITAPKLHTTAVQDKLGYTPVAFNPDFNTQNGRASSHIAGPLSYGITGSGRYVKGWWQGVVGSTPTHIKTSLWGGGSPRGNDDFIMGGFEIVGYNYDAGNTFEIIQFHNWSGSLPGNYRTHMGQYNPSNSVYVSSDGFVCLRLNGSSYVAYDVALMQHPIYAIRNITITSIQARSSNF
jgi:hypothetical protein